MPIRDGKETTTRSVEAPLLLPSFRIQLCALNVGFQFQNQLFFYLRPLLLFPLALTFVTWGGTRFKIPLNKIWFECEGWNLHDWGYLLRLPNEVRVSRGGGIDFQSGESLRTFEGVSLSLEWNPASIDKKDFSREESREGRNMTLKWFVRKMVASSSFSLLSSVSAWFTFRVDNRSEHKDVNLPDTLTQHKCYLWNLISTFVVPVATPTHPRSALIPKLRSSVCPAIVITQRRSEVEPSPDSPCYHHHIQVHRKPTRKWYAGLLCFRALHPVGCKINFLEEESGGWGALSESRFDDVCGLSTFAGLYLHISVLSYYPHPTFWWTCGWWGTGDRRSKWGSSVKMMLTLMIINWSYSAQHKHRLSGPH